jgi:hypothetical protein
MSALYIVTNNEHTSETDILKARAELAALSATVTSQADSLQAWADLWSHVCKRLGADDVLPNESNFDGMLEQCGNLSNNLQAERIAALEQAVSEARELLTSLEWNDYDQRVVAWLAAHPAPAQAEHDAELLDEWRARL